MCQTTTTEIFGSCTGAPSRCRLLGLLGPTTPFLSPALDPTYKFHSLVSDAMYLQKAVLVVSCLGPRKDYCMVFICANWS